MVNESINLENDAICGAARAFIISFDNLAKENKADSDYNFVVLL